MKNLRNLAASLAVAASVALPLAAQAQADNDTTTQKKYGIAERVLRAIASENDKFSLALYPAASYSDNVGFAIGVMPMVQFQIEGRDKPSTVTTTFMVSTKHMFQAQADADIFVRGNRNIVARAEYFFQPDNYYGVGNERKEEPLGKYDFYRYLLTSDIMQQFESRWEVGLTVDLTHMNFKKVETDDVQALYIDECRGTNVGLGVAAGFDNRDDVLSPRRGWYLRTRALGYASALGSDFEFGSFTIDARRYLPVGQESTLALQAYWSAVTDGAPFYKMPTCGGTRLGRAIPHNLKYVDREAWLMQGELRFPLFWRLGATTFAGAGNVSSKPLSSTTFDDAHLMAGAGLRLKVFPNKNLKLRFDMGFSSRGEHAIYMNIREAF